MLHKKTVIMEEFMFDLFVKNPFIWIAILAWAVGFVLEFFSILCAYYEKEQIKLTLHKYYNILKFFAKLIFAFAMIVTAIIFVVKGIMYFI